jgi:hypothetical protein
VALISDVRGFGRVAVSRGVVMIALIAGLCLFSVPALAQISLVHATACGVATFPAAPCTIPATATGNLLVVAWSAAHGNTPTTISITDNVGNSYAQAGNARAVDAVAGQMVDIWYAKNSNSGATSVTITPSAGVTGAATIWEFSGADRTAPLDQTLVLNSQAATATPSSGSITTSSPGEAIVSVVVPAGSMVGLQAGNAFASDSINFGVGWAHLLTPSAGAYAAQWNTSAGSYAASTVSFKAAASGSALSALNACDLNADGVVNVLDVNRSVSMTLGQSSCTANITGSGVCTVVTVQRVVNASLPGGTCVVNSGAVIPTGLSCAPSSVSAPGNSSCSGTLSGAAPSGGLTLTLSSNSASVTVPSSVTVAAGTATFGFTATVGSITTNQTAVLTASANGASPTVSLSLTAPSAGSHSVALAWVASTSTTVAGYNVYRGTASGGPYATRLNSSLVAGLSYTDTTVLAGQTYYYVVTSVDTSGNESGFSTQAVATIP